MRRRVGHGRPVGTVTAWSRFSWAGADPQLGDVAFETVGPGGDPEELRRAFLLVGIEETSSAARPWRLQFERLGWDDAVARCDAGAACWFWHQTP